MNFSFLEDFHKKWRDILVIGKTIEQDNKKYHLMGMTLSEEAKLYIIEPYTEPEKRSQKGIHNQRRIQKEQEQDGCRYLHCSDFYLGKKRLQVAGGEGHPLTYSSEDYGTIQLFFDMMSAGWSVPEWMKETDWDSLQLVTLDIANIKRLPAYSPEMPITITHRPDPARHLLEKTVTLTVGKARSFSFTDHEGDQVQCHINSVTCMDVWQSIKEQFRDPKLTKKFSAQQLEQAEKRCYEAIEQSCPKGMCYIGIEYECSKDLNLVFYSKQYLKSRPEVHKGSSAFLLVRLKPDKETGTHGLPLKGCVIQTPVPPDTSKIPAELFLYYEKVREWTETVS